MLDIRNIKTRPELLRLLSESAAKVAAMSQEELADLRRKQRESYVRAEMSWPADCPYR